MSYDTERGRSSYQGSGGNGGGFGREATREDPLVTSLVANINQISNNVTTITKFTSTLGTPKDSQESRAKLNATIETTKQIARTATQQMKDLGNNTRGTPEERNHQKTIQQKLAKDLGVWVQKFQDVSKQSVQKERSTPLPPTSSYNSAPSQSAARTQQGGGSQKNGQFTQYDEVEDEKQSLLEASRREAFLQIENEREFNDAMIQDREEGIKQIESTIIEVNGIFSDLAQIVQEQGGMIDNIETNVESTSNYTAEANVELRKASKYQKKSRTKMCILAVIIAVIIAVIVIVVFVVK